MNEQTLKSMLREADETAPLAAAQLTAAKVGVRAAQLTAVRRRRVALGLIAVIGAGFFLIQQSVPRSNPALTKPLVRSADPSDAVKEIALLSEKANLQEKTVAALLCAEGRVRRQAMTADLLAQSDLPEMIAENRNRAAQILLDGGDRMTAATGNPQAAAEACQRVLELFPESRAAQVASKRISQLKG